MEQNKENKTEWGGARSGSGREKKADKAKWIGINPSLMRKYKAGLSVPQGKSRQLIRRGLQNAAERLWEVRV